MVAIGRRLRKLWPLWVVLAALLAVVLVLFLPPLLIAPYGLKDPEKRLAAENAMRTTLAGTFGGLAVIAGAIVGALNFRETGRQNRAVLELQRRGQVTERFSKAIEQLGEAEPEKLDVRIGAAYALEQIAQDSPELHWPIMEVLTACLRAHARPTAPATGPDPSGASETRAAADAQAIATVIGRRRHEHDPSEQRLDLRGVHMTQGRWDHAHLERADLSGAQLEEALLGQAQLEEADLSKAQLNGAYLGGAQLKRADLSEAELKGAFLNGAQLEGARLGKAQLNSAYLGGAQLKGAYLGGAQLEEADLSRAQLEGADLGGALLTGADLTDARDLTWAQLQAAANIDQAKLPVYLVAEQREPGVSR